MSRQATKLSVDMIRSAVFSPCGTYRYELRRTWESSLPILVTIGLNPSTADGYGDDPTIRKEIGFASRWGYGGIVKVNMFAFRSTDPRAGDCRVRRLADRRVGQQRGRSMRARHRNAATLLEQVLVHRQDGRRAPEAHAYAGIRHTASGVRGGA